MGRTIKEISGSIKKNANLSDAERKTAQEVCPHDLVAKLATASGIADVCPICKKTVYAESNHKGRLFEGGPRLDFTRNPLGASFIPADSMIISAIGKSLTDAAEIEPGMTVFGFISTIDESMYEDPKTVTDILAQRTKKL